MAELDSITVRGFKSIASIDRLSLGPINIVIGPNGSGKSNFIGVFSFLHAIREGHLQEYVIQAGGADRVLHFGSKTTSNVSIEISFEDGRSRYSLDLASTDADELVPVPRRELILFDSRNSASDPHRRPMGEMSDTQILRLIPEALSGAGKEAGISAAAKSFSRAGYIRGRLQSWRAYHFHDTSISSPMKKTVDVNDNRYLRPDGSNLAAFLYYLRLKHETAYGLIRRTVQRVAPFFDDFQLEPQNLNPNKIRLEWRHKGSEAYFDASALSDGTLRFIALSTLFLQPEMLRPSVILVDEPELGLHPYAITMLASLIKQAPATAKTQVIVSTQSPQLLDHFQPENVLVADRLDGGTQLVRLDAEKLSAWLEDYSLGQLWEKNELGGRPTGE